ncbi:MAG: hypothetical protein GY816_06480 [Cytophagales bacterium]|nr:hypothetical protein [Cytophagales bacterium]
MKKANQFTWIGLVTLTLLTFYFSESSYSGRNLAIIAMGIATIKFLGIGFQFMEIKNANISWKILLSGLIIVIAVAVVFFS